MPAQVRKFLKVEIVAKSDDLRRVYGWAYVCKTKDGKQVVDTHGDTIFEGDLEEASIDFIKHFRRGGEMHEGDAPNELIACAMMSEEIKSAMGIPAGTIPSAWWVGFECTPDSFAKVKDGQFLMFSIQGEAEETEKVQVEV